MNKLFPSCSLVEKILKEISNKEQLPYSEKSVIKLNLQMSNFHCKQKSFLDMIKFSTISMQIYAPSQPISTLTESQLISFMQH